MWRPGSLIGPRGQVPRDVTARPSCHDAYWCSAGPVVTPRCPVPEIDVLKRTRLARLVGPRVSVERNIEERRRRKGSGWWRRQERKGKLGKGENKEEIVGWNVIKTKV